MMRILFGSLLVLLILVTPVSPVVAEPVIPSTVRMEHEELQREFEAAGVGGGRVPQAVRRVHLLLKPHFEKEEELVLPLLGYLPDLAAGHDVPERAMALQKGRAMEKALPKMLAEHKAVAQAVSELLHVAREEKQYHAEQLGEKLLLHARNEEEVLYPAAVLVGKYLAALEKRS